MQYELLVVPTSMDTKCGVNAYNPQLLVLKQDKTYGYIWDNSTCKLTDHQSI
jgi:hypothetical protein